jgi:hypothetical protein
MLAEERPREAREPLPVVPALGQGHEDLALDLPVTADLVRVVPGRVLRTRCFHSTQPLTASIT